MWINKEEVKNKWCPMTHSRNQVALDISETQTAVIANNNCIGESCACWQTQYFDKRELGRCGLTNQTMR